MKNLLFALLIPASVFASDCEVGGISDSPQSMTCEIQQGKKVEKLNLICTDGQYEIAWLGKSFTVSESYHEDVEEGSSPLVFVAEKLTLRTVSFTGYSKAQLVSEGKGLIGKCFDN